MACRPTRRNTASRLADQSDEQIDAWASELMRDVVIRRGVVRVIEDFRRRLTSASLNSNGCSLPAADRRPSSDGIGMGNLIVPAITLFALVPGIRSQVADGGLA